MLPYSISARAERDLVAVRRWYDEQGPNLADQALQAIRDATAVARERPGSCPKYRGDTRAVRCKRFPYRVYFEWFPDRIVVAAVYHTSRRASAWNDPDRE